MILAWYLCQRGSSASGISLYFYGFLIEKQLKHDIQNKSFIMLDVIHKNL